MSEFQRQKAYLKKNPPQSIKGLWVECLSPTSTLTKGEEYYVRGHFWYMNIYGSKGNKFPMWDEFITIKNDDGWTVKVNRSKFSSNTVDRPLTKVEKLEKRVRHLEILIKSKEAL